VNCSNGGLLQFVAVDSKRLTCFMFYSFPCIGYTVATTDQSRMALVCYWATILRISSAAYG